MLIRDLQKDKQHGRKLDTNWLSLRLVVKMTPREVSGYVKEHTLESKGGRIYTRHFGPAQIQSHVSQK